MNVEKRVAVATQFTRTQIILNQDTPAPVD